MGVKKMKRFFHVFEAQLVLPVTRVQFFDAQHKDVTCARLGNCTNCVVEGSVRKKTSNGWPEVAPFHPMANLRKGGSVRKCVR